MKTSRYVLFGLGLSAVLGLAVLAQTNTQQADSLATHPGWMLAAGCFACHGTDGNDPVFGRLSGEEAAELIKEMAELKTTNSADAAIMKVHTLGYTDEQIKLIADYFSKVRR